MIESIYPHTDEYQKARLAWTDLNSRTEDPNLTPETFLATCVTQLRLELEERTDMIQIASHLIEVFAQFPNPTISQIFELLPLQLKDELRTQAVEVDLDEYDLLEHFLSERSIVSLLESELDELLRQQVEAQLVLTQVDAGNNTPLGIYAYGEYLRWQEHASAFMGKLQERKHQAYENSRRQADKWKIIVDACVPDLLTVMGRGTLHSRN